MKREEIIQRVTESPTLKTFQFDPDRVVVLGVMTAEQVQEVYAAEGEKVDIGDGLAAQLFVAGGQPYDTHYIIIGRASNYNETA
jgi:hypothetical protein